MAAAPCCRTRGKQEMYQKRVMDGLLLHDESICYLLSIFFCSSPIINLRVCIIASLKVFD